MSRIRQSTYCARRVVAWIVAALMVVAGFIVGGNAFATESLLGLESEFNTNVAFVGAIVAALSMAPFVAIIESIHALAVDRG